MFGFKPKGVIQIEPWVRDEHKDALLFCQNVYTPPFYKNVHGWRLIIEARSYGVWEKNIEGTIAAPNATRRLIIAIKGTSNIRDLLDDVKIGSGRLSKNTFLSKEIRAVIRTLFPNLQPNEQIDPDQLLLTGHSLGGFVAIQLASEFKVTGVSFNGAGTVVSPTNFGQQQNIYHYHIVGDFISTHVSNQTANVTRAMKKSFSGTFFDIRAHSISSFFVGTDPTQKLLTADEEQDLFTRWTYSNEGVLFFVPARLNPI